ncbi:hypothetical protein F4824DRAFT_498932 [Ustulina deusta]|nr:hypothetical protein F4824DRAFT_498932 [Ustulina deusta]
MPADFYAHAPCFVDAAAAFQSSTCRNYDEWTEVFTWRVAMITAAHDNTDLSAEDTLRQLARLTNTAARCAGPACLAETPLAAEHQQQALDSSWPQFRNIYRETAGCRTQLLSELPFPRSFDCTDLEAMDRVLKSYNFHLRYNTTVFPKSTAPEVLDGKATERKFHAIGSAPALELY